MNRTRRLAAKFGILLGSALLGCTAYGQPSASVGVSVQVQIRAESDFYQPLASYGRWEVVGSYGRCWIPGRVEADWRPYSEGYWQRTEAGWYWASDEPWAWATYHYGRWDLSPQFGWYWVPQTQWAPAWVSWHRGGGYVGWAPLYPSGVRVVSPRAYVFVEERHFTEPVRRSTVVVNNTTIINQTVINEAPDTAVIEKASGRKVQAVPVQELRHKAEAAVVAQQPAPASASATKAQPPVRSEAQPRETKPDPAREPVQVGKPAAAPAGPVASTPQKHEARVEKHQPVPAALEIKPEAKPEGNPAVPIKASTVQKTGKQVEKPAKPVKPSDKAVQPPAKERPAESDKSGPNPVDQGHEKKVRE